MEIIENEFTEALLAVLKESWNSNSPEDLPPFESSFDEDDDDDILTF